MGLENMPGALGWVSSSRWEAVHADWPAYPGDESWEFALLRMGDFPFGTEFTCISVIDQVALFKAEVGIKEPDPFSPKHMHLAIRLEELLELDERGYVTGIEIDLSLSPDQILQKRAMGPEFWERFLSGEVHVFYEHNGKRIPVEVAERSRDFEMSQVSAVP